MSTQDSLFEGVIQTAWPVAYGRTFSDIPYAKDIFEELIKVRGVSRAELFDETQIRVGLAPQFEARHKILDRLLRESGIKQVLEFASGLTTRGIIITEDPNVLYVETDLPIMLEEKKLIIESLTVSGKLPRRDNLNFVSANALSYIEIEQATNRFKEEPIAVIHEGLLRYLNFKQKATVAKNIHKLLTKFGGVWIMPDISTERLIAKDGEKAKVRIKKISKLTGRNINQNLFKNTEHAKKFFEELGFVVEVHLFTEVAQELVTPDFFETTKDELEEMIGTAVAFVMRLGD